MLMLIGLTFLAVLAVKNLLRTYCRGSRPLFSMVGMAPRWNSAFCTWTGLSMGWNWSVPAVVGLFAVPELVEMARQKTGVARLSLGTTVREDVGKAF